MCINPNRSFEGVVAVICHSPDYREAFHPHCRMVERNIFKKDIKQLITDARKEGQ